VAREMTSAISDGASTIISTWVAAPQPTMTSG
jgi:hypothetical protein